MRLLSALGLSDGTFGMPADVRSGCKVVALWYRALLAGVAFESCGR